MSKEWRERPSSLLGLDDAYLSYCVDEAVFMFGRYVESEMQAAEDRTKNAKHKAGARQQALSAILNSPVASDTDEPDQPPPPPSTKQFRDPAALFRK